MKKIIVLSLLLFLSTKPVVAVEKTYAPNLFEKIVPGQTSQKQVLAVLGTPTKTSSDSSYYWYQAQDGVRFQTVIFDQGKVLLVTTHVLENNAENIAKYGSAELTTYNLYRFDTKTHFYNDKGLALTADDEGKILVKQRFVPGKMAEFFSKWGKEFPQETPYTEGKTEQSEIPVPDAPPTLWTQMTGLVNRFWNQLTGLIFSINWSKLKIW